MRAVGPIDKSHNPYESIYRSLNLSIGDDTSFDEAEELTRHLGMIHNTLGLAIKDLVEVLKHSFPEKQRKRRRIEIDDSYMQKPQKDIQENNFTNQAQQNPLKKMLSMPKQVSKGEAQREFRDVLSSKLDKIRNQKDEKKIEPEPIQARSPPINLSMYQYNLEMIDQNDQKQHQKQQQKQLQKEKVEEPASNQREKSVPVPVVPSTENKNETIIIDLDDSA